jgi:hypothetical protein
VQKFQNLNKDIKMANTTNLTIDGLYSVCVPLSNANFSDVAAIYIIICVNPDGSWTIIDIGQSGELGTRIDLHDRRECWKRKCSTGNIWVCVYPMPANKYSKQERLNLERNLRSQHTNLCGER